MSHNLIPLTAVKLNRSGQVLSFSSRVIPNLLVVDDASDSRVTLIEITILKDELRKQIYQLAAERNVVWITG